MNSDNIKAGYSILMTHKERMEFLKTSHLGKVLGVQKILNEKVIKP